MSETERKFNTGLAQINPVVGDLKNNALKIVEYIKKAKDLNLDLLVFPELALFGLPNGNIFERHKYLIQENIKWLEGIAGITKNISILLGFAGETKDGKFENSVALLKDGKVEKVFKQKNNFSNLFELNGVKYSVIIGEILFDENTLNNDSGADVCINISSIPSRCGQEQLKNNMLSSCASKLKTPVIHINQVGAVDNLSFDGGSRMYNNKGELKARAKLFEEQLLVINPIENTGDIYPLLKGMEAKISPNEEFSLSYENDLEITYKTIVQGITDYFKKCGLKRAVLGLSGGLDSTVCAVLLADALGKNNVIGVSMPSKITSSESKNDARELAQNLGIAFFELPIKPIVSTASESLENVFGKIESVWTDRYKNSFTQDNIQARSRATYLWCISNEFPSCIPVATSDKSEAYMGYATINGDMTGGFAPIADVTKTKLFALARWLNKNRAEKNVIPESVILKRPGAELAIDPKTGKALCAEDALMPYEFLDEVIWRTENKNECYDEILNSEFVYEKEHKISKSQKTEWLNKFYGRMSKALYKWSIMPPAVIVDRNSINKYEYSQPITSGRIDYKGLSKQEIKTVLTEVMTAK